MIIFPTASPADTFEFVIRTSDEPLEITYAAAEWPAEVTIDDKLQSRIDEQLAEVFR